MAGVIFRNARLVDATSSEAREDFDVLVEEGTISVKDVDLFTFVETADEAWELIATANGVGLNEKKN